MGCNQLSVFGWLSVNGDFHFFIESGTVPLMDFPVHVNSFELRVCMRGSLHDTKNRDLKYYISAHDIV